MKSRHINTYALLSSTAMVFLLLDTQTAVDGAREGISLCLRSVIPSLFPFIVLSSMLRTVLAGKVSSLFCPVMRLCRLPKGSEGLFLLGCVSGYPVGAQCVAQAYRDGQLSREDGLRMLSVCNNAGPAFIFGIAGTLFTKNAVPWLLWLIQVLSSILAGVLLPGKCADRCILEERSPISLPQALTQSIRVLGGVCGWVILFRILIALLAQWAFPYLSPSLHLLTTGVLELTNGCLSLSSLENEGIRFLHCSFFLAFGGLCVTMQTAFVSHPLGISLYFPGKLLQACIATGLCECMRVAVYGSKVFPLLLLLPVLGTVLIHLYSRLRKKL